MKRKSIVEKDELGGFQSRSRVCDSGPKHSQSLSFNIATHNNAINHVIGDEKGPSLISLRSLLVLDLTAALRTKCVGL